MNVVRVETLGDVVAFKPKEIQVLGAIYDKIPSEFMEDFELVCNTAKSTYDKSVLEAKVKGEKPKSAALKKEAIAQIITPFLSRFGIEEKVTHQRVIRTDNPRIPGDNEKISVRPKSIIVDTDFDIDELHSVFDLFDSETLSDERVEINLEESGGEVMSIGEDLFEDDGFDFEGLLDD